jgi:hypothetical protein
MPNDNAVIEAVRNEIRKVCEDFAEFLIDKNTKYGNSVLEPVSIMAKGRTVEELISARQDDKLSRMKSMQPEDMEDPEKDFSGYWVLRQVHRRILGGMAGVSYDASGSKLVLTDQSKTNRPFLDYRAGDDNE